MSRKVLRLEFALPALLLGAAMLLLPSGRAFAAMTAETPEISAGAEAYLGASMGAQTPLPEASSPGPHTDNLLPGIGWDAIKFIDNANLTGFYQIPPDPMGAAGTDRVINVVNSSFEAWNKAGGLLWRTSLNTLFTGTTGYLNTGGFDPRVQYDPYTDRFVICMLEQTTSPQASRILVAVSKTGTPASGTPADWYTFSINSAVTIGSATWADFPGLAVDEEAIYITTNQFTFSAGTFAGHRLRIIPKAPFYSGGAASFATYDPIAGAPGSVGTTGQPASVFGPGGAGPGIGTYLVYFSGLNDGSFSYLQVIRVNNPLGAVSFTGEFINVGGNIDNFAGGLPGMPQLGGTRTIDSGDRRSQFAVWRNNRLWVVATVNPVVGPNTGQATVHFWEVGTAGVVNSASPAGLLTNNQQGDVGGEDIAPATHTTRPSLAVNAAGDVKIGFSASSATTYAGAYVTGRQAGDAPGTVQNSGLVRAGVAYYVRSFSSNPAARNRWGDYSGISLDPTDDRIFWIFNEYADVRGNPTTVGGVTEDGQWGTAWGSCSFSCLDIACPTRIDAPRGGQAAIQVCLTNCAPFADTYTLTYSDAQNWCPPGQVVLNLAAGETRCVTVVCDVPANAPCDLVDLVVNVAAGSTGLTKTCVTQLVVDCSTPTRMMALDAEALDGGGAVVRWDMAAGTSFAGFHVYREAGITGRVRLTDQMITGAGPFEYVDADYAGGDARYWIEEIGTDGSSNWHGPVLVTGSSSAPVALSFGAARPNPFSGATTLAFSLPESRNVRLAVYDMAGRLVRTLVAGVQPAGSHVATWDGLTASGNRAAIGLYLVRFEAGSDVRTQKVMVAR
jgi:hypothetical protein